MHAIIPVKCHKYPSTTILKHDNVLAEVSKSPYVILPNMTPYNICTVFHYTYAPLPYWKLFTNEGSQIML